LYSGKYEHEALPEFLKWKDQFSGQTPVAIFHNAPFDVGFLQAAFERYELDAGRFLRRVRDTATMSPNVFGEKDYPRSLEEICKRLNIVKLGNHDALHDALATHKAFFAMKKILDERRPAAWLLNKQSLWNIFTPDPALVPYGVIRGY
jgi:DNA polymerase III epsilon subunit-like protein